MIYGTWIILCVISSGILGIFTFKLLYDKEKTGYADFAMYLINFPLLLIVALNAVSLQFICSSSTAPCVNGVVNYQGDYYFLYIYLGQAFFDLAMVIISIFFTFQNMRKNKLYPKDEEEDWVT